MPVDRSQLQRMIDSMERALTRMEEEQQARHDEERKMEEDCYDELAIGNTLPTPIQAPFSDGIHGGVPENIHQEPKRDLFK